MGDTSIQWTDKTWNPTRGCSRVSQGCVNCYAERQAARFAQPPLYGMPPDTAGPFHGFVKRVNGHPAWTGKVELIESKLTEPLRWRKPARIFVNSMSDLFHEALPDEAIDRVFAVMALCPQHTFQILTKRPDRLRKWASEQNPYATVGHRIATHGNNISAVWKRELPNTHSLTWPLPNVWLGVSVEDQATADERIPLLLQTPAAVRFVSYEPALGPVDFSPYIFCVECKEKDGFNAESDGLCKRPILDQIIVGGESGPGARPFDLAWARQTIKQCHAAGVACFVKQLGAKPFQQHAENCNENRFRGPKERVCNCTGGPLDLLDKKGGDMAEWPEDLRVREFPLARRPQ